MTVGIGMIYKYPYNGNYLFAEMKAKIFASFFCIRAEWPCSDSNINQNIKSFASSGQLSNMELPSEDSCKHKSSPMENVPYAIIPSLSIAFMSRMFRGIRQRYSAQLLTI